MSGVDGPASPASDAVASSLRLIFPTIFVRRQGLVVILVGEARHSQLRFRLREHSVEAAISG